MDEITAVHDLEYIQQLKDTAENKAPTVVADFDDPDGFTYMTSTSFDDALKVYLQNWIFAHHQREVHCHKSGDNVSLEACAAACCPWLLIVTLHSSLTQLSEV